MSDPHNSQGMHMNYVAAARAAWQAWAGELDRQRAGRNREAQRRARIRAHSERELQRFAQFGQEWAIAELRRRGVVNA
jgi:hypothetical protein